MRKNIFIFNFKNIPAGLLALLLLFIITESALYSMRADLIDDYWNKFIINEHMLIEQPKDYDYLIIGDSLQKTGITPATISDKILNLGLPGSKPLGQFLLLKRYLGYHKAPKVVFLYIDPEYSYESMLVILRYFVSMPEFISIFKDLTWAERQAFLTRYFVSLDTRNINREAKLAHRDRYMHPNSAFIESMKGNQGYMSSPRADNAIGDDYFSSHKERYQDKVSFTKRDEKYLDKLIALADSHNIKVVFLNHILPDGLYDTFEKTGFNSNYLSFIDRLRSRYPGVYFVKDPLLTFENRYFGDMSHLNGEGARLYTEYFRDRIFLPLQK